MLRVELPETLATAFDSASLMDLETNSFRPSMLCSVLPAIVSNRLPTIPSLRQSLSDVRTRSSHSKSNSVTELPQPETPPPGYASIPPSGSVTPYRLSVALGEADLDFVDDVSEGPNSPGSTLPLAFDRHETGIRWQYASLGKETTFETIFQTTFNAGQKGTNCSRDQPHGPSIPRVECTDRYIRRNVCGTHAPTVYTRHDVPTSRSTNGTYTRRDVEPPGSSSGRIGDGHYSGREYFAEDSTSQPEPPKNIFRRRHDSPPYNCDPRLSDFHLRTVPSTIHHIVPLAYIPVRKEASNHEATSQFRRHDGR
jgi:hypothetical protein